MFIYIGLCLHPLQELVDSMTLHWTDRLNAILPITSTTKTPPVVKLTGEMAVDLKLLESATLILATAEQWDGLSRRWRQRRVIQSVSLYIFDELHMLGSALGRTLEVVISRTRYMASQLASTTSSTTASARIIGLSSSLANAKEVGDWLGAPLNCTFNFSLSSRPVPLVTYLHAFEQSHAASRLLAMTRPVCNAIRTHCGGSGGSGGCIVYTPSRKQSQLTAIDIMTSLMTNHEGGDTKSSDKEQEVRMHATL